MSITPFVVSFIVNKHTNEIQSIDVLYAVNAKKEVAALDEPEFRPINGTALTTSAISISNLLDYVNYYFPDILPESVLKHFENKFYIHNMNLQNKSETVSLNTKDKKSRGYISYDLSRTNNIANNVSNVNNTDTKFSLDVDRFSNDLRNTQLWQYDGYEHFFKAKKLYQQKRDIFHYHAK